jgi:hypothetical protein
MARRQAKNFFAKAFLLRLKIFNHWPKYLDRVEG